MKKITVLVSGGGTNLQALISACQKGKIKNGKISLVLSSNPNAYAIERAKAANIRTIVVNRKKYSDAKNFNDELLHELKRENPDIIVLAGFMCILDKRIIEHFKNKIINVHPSLIPSFSGKGFYGLHVHEAALKRGVKITGATVHFVNEIPDGGPIILQKSVPVYNADTPEILQKRVMEQAEWLILPEAVSLICSEKFNIKNNIVNIEV